VKSSKSKIWTSISGGIP